VKALRIELGGEPLDVLGGEVERAKLTLRADLGVLEITHR
jgi:hypothetical protein